ncbi:MAG: DciA family protein [Beijerinckiaceae bacterium]|nr:DciA family protein [Beijerinckiaceae bacterium]
MRNRHVKKIPWSRPIGDLVQTALDPVLTRRGFGASGLVLYWDDIAGERLAAVSRPVKVQWPVRRRGHPEEDGSARAALAVRVETGFALELQHLAPAVIERVNAHFGWRCISRLVLMQGPVGARSTPARVPCPVDKAAAAAVEELIGNAVEEPLRQALTRLGAHVLGGPQS